jgi:hypothetical protein
MKDASLADLIAVMIMQIMIIRTQEESSWQ